MYGLNVTIFITHVRNCVLRATPNPNENFDVSPNSNLPFLTSNILIFHNLISQWTNTHCHIHQSSIERNIHCITCIT